MRRNQCYCFTVLVVAFAICGCNRQQPQTATPAAGVASPVSTTRSVEQPAAPQHQIQVKSVGKNAQIVHLVKPGTVVVWTGSMEFYVHFIHGDNFCEEPQVPRYPGFYAATKNPAPAANPAGFRLQCTVKHDIPNSQEFGYEVIGKLPPKPPMPGLLLRTTPCGGCNEGTNDSGN